MKYFTRGWTNGEFSDEQADQVRDAYWHHLEELLPRFPPSAVRLATEIRLHDGVIERVRVNGTTRTLVLSLVCGDNQQGYSQVELRYGGTLLGANPLGTMRQRARDRETLVLYDEVDVGEDDGEYVHRLLFWPEGEVNIWFRQLDVAVSRRMDDRVSLGGCYVDEGD